MDPTVARAAAVAAEQRDRDMVLQLGGLVFQGAEAAAGATRVRPWRRELAALARLLYYAVTAGRGWIQ